MAATLTTPPPARALSGDNIFVVLGTDAIVPDYAYFEITISGAGPSVADTLALTWPGGNITYTVAAAIDSTGLLWPTKGGGETLTDYTNRVAEFLRHREDVAAVFAISVEDAAGGVIRLTHPVAEAFDLGATDAMTNVAITIHDGVAPTTAENLRAFLEVWTDTGNFNTDEVLLAQHSPYDVATQETYIDIAPAFAHLEPELPPTTTINPAIAVSLIYGEVTSPLQKYYLRYADKYGTPAVAEALLRTVDSYLAVLGSLAGDSKFSAAAPRRHAYTRRDGATFRKPVSETQPDWMYWICPAGVSSIYATVTVHWSDGTDSTYNPWGTTGEPVEEGKMYYFATGYRQISLHTVSPSGGTDPDAYIVGYKYAIANTGGPMLGTHNVEHSVVCDSEFGLYLLFDNGVGGCESVWLRGKAAAGYDIEGESFRRPRRPDHSIATGDFQALATSGRTTLSLSTGWYDEPYYLEHLRQLPLAQAWLIDIDNKAFRRVIVEPKSLDSVTRDDETLYSLEFKALAGWIDTSSNL